MTAPPLQVVSLNLNGIRSACRKGLGDWLAQRRPDIVCVQELKAQDKDMDDSLRTLAGLSGYFACAERPGYAGVGIYTRVAPRKVCRVFGDALLDSEGRFIQLDFPACTIVSLYMPSGSSGEARQAVKYEVMARVYQRLKRYKQQAARRRRDFIICADWNIAHTQKDIRNWRGNQKNSGFLPQERAWIDSVLETGLGWRDVFRCLNGEEGEYTWWSNRGNAWANNVGWRIDYQLAPPGTAAKACAADIYKAQRFSDHAPLTIRYQLSVDG